VKAVSISLKEAKIWTAKAQAGDPEALEYYSGLFANGDPCWLCDEPVGGGGSISTFEDPTRRGWGIMSPICGVCYGLPPAARLKREMAMIKAFWPKAQWRGWR
jgi:hypothetical protein